MGGFIGTILGITPSFIVYGLMGIVGVLVPTTFLNNDIVNILFLPAICFAGGVAGLAYAATRDNYKLVGTNGTKSLWFACDLQVYMAGGIFGAIGYAFLTLFAYFKLPMDCGAATVFISGVLVRKFIAKANILSCKKEDIKNILKSMKMNITNLFLPPAILGIITAIVVQRTGNVFICFYISAISLYFIQIDPEFPATHHITLTAAYATSVCTNSYLGIAMAIIAGIGSQIIFESFNKLCNYGIYYDEKESEAILQKASHVDPPAAAIFAISIIVFISKNLLVFLS